MCVICGYMCVTIVCKPCSNVMNFEVELIFLIKPLFLHDQNVVTKLKYLEDEKSFSDETKIIFDHFYRVFNQTNNTNFFGR